MQMKEKTRLNSTGPNTGLPVGWTGDSLVFNRKENEHFSPSLCTSQLTVFSGALYDSWISVMRRKEKKPLHSNLPLPNLHVLSLSQRRKNFFLHSQRKKWEWRRNISTCPTTRVKSLSFLSSFLGRSSCVFVRFRECILDEILLFWRTF
jgi:hypothetical protein